MGCSVRGRLQCMIVDAKTKKVLRAFPPQKNLILNQGLANFFTVTTVGMSTCFSYAVAGTNATPTQDDSGTTTASQTGTTVTLSGGSFTLTDTSTDAGKLIKWDTGEVSRIVTVTSPTECEVHISQSVSAGEFTVYRTNQSGLFTESKRTNSYVSGSCGTDILQPHQVEHFRTFDFSVESGSVTYNEVGMSHTATVAANLWCRVKLDTPVSLISGQQFRVVYRLRVTYAPATPRTKTAVVPDWPISPATNTDGAEAWETQSFNPIASGGTTGSNVGGWDYMGLTTSSRNMRMLTSSTALLNPPSSAGLNIGLANIANLGIPSRESYAANSGRRVLYSVAAPAVGNTTSLRSIEIGYDSGIPVNAHYSIFRYRFGQAQTKEDTHRLTMRFLYVVEREL